jgi:outer membrane lipoprotein LolB
MAAAVLAATALLVGCAAAPRRGAPAAAPTAAELAALAQLSDFTVAGRVAVQSRGEGWSASFDWREAAGRGTLAVRGPFGAGAARITRSDERVVIESGSGVPLEVAAPFDGLDAALAARLGFALPLEPLRYWILGVPAPGLASEGAAGSFRQADWDVACAAYARVAGAPAPLPGRLVLTRAATRIRVVIDRWHVDAP